ncbi:hypothetical protein [Lacticaseibacillus mingshuiensis]|uniref:Uncharacterized protein n=1 Tax=Lacticaseibacillus mingshuiensis TaxID=2799574 RepID=A0ABW4CK28_9LACO|nr:hypothetical protein [Lacticaseibacillus mingshuiensis]
MRLTISELVDTAATIIPTPTLDVTTPAYVMNLPKLIGTELSTLPDIVMFLPVDMRPIRTLILDSRGGLMTSIFTTATLAGHLKELERPWQQKICEFFRTELNKFHEDGALSENIPEDIFVGLQYFVPISSGMKRSSAWTNLNYVDQVEIGPTNVDLTIRSSNGQFKLRLFPDKRVPRDLKLRYELAHQVAVLTAEVVKASIGLYARGMASELSPSKAAYAVSPMIPASSANSLLPHVNREQLATKLRPILTQELHDLSRVEFVLDDLLETLSEALDENKIN